MVSCYLIDLLTDLTNLTDRKHLNGSLHITVEFFLFLIYLYFIDVFEIYLICAFAIFKM